MPRETLGKYLNGRYTKMQHPSLGSYLKSVSALMHRVAAVVAFAVLGSGSSHAAGIPIVCSQNLEPSFFVESSSSILFLTVTPTIPGAGMVTESPPEPGLEPPPIGKFQQAPGNCPGVTTTGWDIKYSTPSSDVGKDVTFQNVSTTLVKFSNTVNPQQPFLFNLFISADGVVSQNDVGTLSLTIVDTLGAASTRAAVPFSTNGSTDFSEQSPFNEPGDQITLLPGEYTLEQDTTVTFHPTDSNASWEISFPNSIDSVLLTPIPEPGSLGVIALSLGVLAVIITRRREFGPTSLSVPRSSRTARTESPLRSL